MWNLIVSVPDHCLSFYFPIETGRWRRIPRENRKCHLCHSDVEDEFHYLLVCRELNNLRRQFIDARFMSRPNIITFSSLLNVKNKGTLKKTLYFCKKYS